MARFCTVQAVGHPVFSQIAQDMVGRDAIVQGTLQTIGKSCICGSQSGWWFGCHFLFSHILGIIIPIDFHIFQRGGPTTNQQFLNCRFNFSQFSDLPPSKSPMGPPCRLSTHRQHPAVDVYSLGKPC